MKSSASKNTAMRFLTAAVLITAVGACTPSPLDGLTNDESLVFITNRDQAVSFGNYETFSISDSIRVIDNRDVGFNNGNVASALISRIAQNMSERGYTRVGRTETPDLGMNVTFVQQTQTGVTANPFWWNDPFFWGGGGGWGGAGWGWGGPGLFYQPYYQFYQVSENYWIIELVDLKNPTNGNQFNVVWNAQIRGANLTANPVRLADAIFEQSAYLRRQ
jgi:hypothetical protein